MAGCIGERNQIETLNATDQNLISQFHNYNITNVINQSLGRVVVIGRVMSVSESPDNALIKITDKQYIVDFYDGYKLSIYGIDKYNLEKGKVYIIYAAKRKLQTEYISGDEWLKVISVTGVSE